MAARPLLFHTITRTLCAILSLFSSVATSTQAHATSCRNELQEELFREEANFPQIRDAMRALKSAFTAMEFRNMLQELSPTITNDPYFDFVGDAKLSKNQMFGRGLVGLARLCRASPDAKSRFISLAIADRPLRADLPPRLRDSLANIDLWDGSVISKLVAGSLNGARTQQFAPHSEIADARDLILRMFNANDLDRLVKYMPEFAAISFRGVDGKLHDEIPAMATSSQQVERMLGAVDSGAPEVWKEFIGMIIPAILEAKPRRANDIAVLREKLERVAAAAIANPGAGAATGALDP